MSVPLPPKNKAFYCNIQIYLYSLILSGILDRSMILFAYLCNMEAYSEEIYAETYKEYANSIESGRLGIVFPI